MAAENVSGERFYELVRGERPVLVDFWAPWCGYCRRIQAAYDKIAEQYGDALAVVKVNIDEEAALAKQERIGVIPTVALYGGGRRLGSIVAPESKAAIDGFVQETLRRAGGGNGSHL